MCNVNAVPGELAFDFLEDTHASKMQFCRLKTDLLEILTSSRNIRYIITKIYMILGTSVSNLVIQKNEFHVIHKKNVCSVHY